MGDDRGGGQDHNADKELELNEERSKPDAGEWKRTRARAGAGGKVVTEMEVGVGSSLHSARLLAMSAEVSRYPIPHTMYAIDYHTP
jgi:hypothetical protein